MTDAVQSNLPIGYWLRKADDLLTARIDAAQQTNHLSRIEWQVLSVVRAGEVVPLDAVATSLRPFADAGTIAEVCQRLVRRGELARAGSAPPAFSLTEQGRRLYATAHAAQQEVRQRAMRGIDEGDYATTMRVLRQLVENLGGE